MAKSDKYSTDGKTSAATKGNNTEQDKRYRADVDLRQNPPRR